MAELYPDDRSLKQFSSRFVTPTFDPTSVRPVISPTQVRPKTLIHQSIEDVVAPYETPQLKLSTPIATNSPKRPLPFDDLDDGPRKMLRAESPLKGAAGRRMDAKRLNGLPAVLPVVQPRPPQPLPPAITYLLSLLPKPHYYNDAQFNPIKMVNLLRDTDIFDNSAARSTAPPLHATPQPQSLPHGWQPPFQQHPQAPVMHPGMMPPGQGPPGQPPYWR